MSVIPTNQQLVSGNKRQWNSYTNHSAFAQNRDFQENKPDRAPQIQSETSPQAYRCQASTDLCTTKITSSPWGWNTEHLQQLEATGVSSEQAARVSEMSIQPKPQPLATLTCVFLHLFWRLVDDFHLLLNQAFMEQGKVCCYNNPE